MLGRRSFAGRRGAAPCVEALRFRAYRDQSVQAAHALTFAGPKLNSGGSSDRDAPVEIWSPHSDGGASIDRTQLEPGKAEGHIDGYRALYRNGLQRK